MNFTHEANLVKVKAYAIESIGPAADVDGVMSVITAGGWHSLTEDMIARHMPAIGDYVVTQEDGYVYVNPKDVFERKYHPI